MKAALMRDQAAVRKLHQILYSDNPGPESASAAMMYYWEAIAQENERPAPVPLDADRLGEYALHTLLTLATETADNRYRAAALTALETGSWQLRLIASRYLFEVDRDRKLFEQHLARLSEELESGSVEFNEVGYSSPTYVSDVEAKKEVAAYWSLLTGETTEDSPLARKLLWQSDRDLL